MAASFPFIGFERIGIRVRSGMASSRRESGGLLITRRRIEPYWGGPLTTGKLSIAEWADAVAFLADCVDRNLRVDFIHPRHRLPRNYLGGGWPLVDDPLLVSVTHGREIVVSGLEVGIVLKRGDRLTLMQGELRCHRMMAADTVVGSTTEQALPLTPRIPLGLFEAAAAVRFIDPPLRLAIVQDSFQDDEIRSESPMTFEVEEALV